MEIFADRTGAINACVAGSGATIKNGNGLIVDNETVVSVDIVTKIGVKHDPMD